MSGSSETLRLHSQARIFQHAGLPALLVRNWQSSWDEAVGRDLAALVFQADDAGNCLVRFMNSHGAVSAELQVPRERVEIAVNGAAKMAVFFRLTGSEGATNGSRLPLRVHGQLAAYVGRESAPADDQELNFDTYWRSAFARAGGFGVTFEDGVVNLLVLHSMAERFAEELENVSNVEMVLLAQDQWNGGGVCMQWKFVDGSGEPLVLQLGTRSLFGRVPTAERSHRPVEVWVWENDAAACIAELEGELLITKALHLERFAE